MLFKKSFQPKRLVCDQNPDYQIKKFEELEKEAAQSLTERVNLKNQNSLNVELDGTVYEVYIPRGDNGNQNGEAVLVSKFYKPKKSDYWMLARINFGLGNN